MTEATVLLVDDELEFLESFSERLANRGFKVDIASNGEEALRKIAEQSYDAIVLDLKMPGMDGIETLARIRDMKPEIQVILLSGQASVPKSVEAVKLGAMDFLEKPANIEEVKEKIQAAKAKRMVLVEKKDQERIQQILIERGW